MKVIGRPHLREFLQTHDEAKGALQSWLREVEAAEWESPDEIIGRYHHAQVLAGGQVTFQFWDNKYCVKAQVNFFARALLIIDVQAFKPGGIDIDTTGRQGARERHNADSRRTM